MSSQADGSNDTTAGFTHLEASWDQSGNPVLTLFRPAKPPADVLATLPTTDTAVTDRDKTREVCYINLADLDRDRKNCFCKACEVQLTSAYLKCQACEDAQFCHGCGENGREGHENHTFEEAVIPELASRLGALQAIAPTEKPDQQKSENESEQHDKLLEIPTSCCATCFDHVPETVKTEWLESSDHHVESQGWVSPHKIYVSDLRTSAHRNCTVCSIVYRSLSATVPMAEEYNITVTVMVAKDRLAVRQAVSYTSPFLSRWMLSIQGNPDYQFNILGLPSAKRLEAEFSSDKVFEKINSWISVCEKNHTHTRCADTSATLLPHRVLCINGSPEIPSLQLLETNGRVRGRYIALSHCWGSVECKKTSTDNLKEHLHGLSFQELPKTFRDAIYCAQKLGVRYVWIDSLCIVQDDPVDWEVESAKMCDIYSQAYLVVIAASASGDTEGFLGSRSKDYQDALLESREGSGIFDIVARERMPHAKPSGSGFRFSLMDSSVQSRAWCMQETVLARRSVAFHGSEIMWECQSSVDCECGTIASDLTIVDSSPHFRTQSYNLKEKTVSNGSLVGPGDPCLSGSTQTFGALSLGNGFFVSSDRFQYFHRPFSERKNIPAATYEEWRHMIVPIYTKKHLTRDTDRLPALSGLATTAAGRCNDDYIAGLWKNDVQLGLLWSIAEAPARAPSKFLAPSFSFASVGRPVVYKLPHPRLPSGESAYGRVSIKLVDIDLTLSRDPFGMVHSGSILVSGLYHKFILGTTSESEESSYFLRSCGEYDGEAKWTADTMLARVPVIYNDSDDDPRFTINRRSTEEGLEGVFEETLFYLIVADVPNKDLSRKFGSHSPLQDEYAGLLLAPSATQEGVYQRLGVLIMSFTQEESRRWLEEADVGEFRIG